MTNNYGPLFENIKTQHDFRRKLNFEIHVVDHCNLNCKYCSHFSPIANPSYTDISGFESDLSLLQRVVSPGRIEKLRILGGEPLLHPQITDFIRIAYIYFPTVRRELVTNGLLIQKMTADFWSVCRETDTHIYVSRYPIDLDYDGIHLLLEAQGIKHIVGCVPKSFDRHPLSLHGAHHHLINHLKCIESSGPYMQISNGGLYKCSYSAYAHHLNCRFSTSFDLKPSDRLDLSTIKSVNDIYRFLSRPIPFCGYCLLSHNTFHNTWGYSRGELSEWADL